MRHLYRGQTRFKTLVAALEAGSVDGLLEGVAGQHAKDNGQAGVHLRELQSARGFGTNVIVMGRFAAQNAANGDERIVTAGGGQFFRCERQLKRARDTHYVHISACSAGALEGIDGCSQQTLGNKVVEAAHNNPKAQTGRGQFTADRTGLEFVGHRDCRYLPLKSAFLFSRKAFVPSRMSSVAQERPNSVASRNKPSSVGISTPRSMASMVYFTASGALAMIFFAMASAAGRSSAGS